VNLPGPRGSARTIAVAAGTIAVITLAARLVGFGRWFAFSHSVGATDVGTVYQSVNAIPNVLYEIAAGGVLAAVVVPLVSGALGRGAREEADRTASALLTWTLAILLPLMLVVVAVAQPISELLVAGDGGARGVALGAELLRIFAIQIPLYGVGIVLAGVLQSHGRFVAAALAPLLSSLVVIATYLTYRALVPDPAAPVGAIPSAAVLVLGVGTTLGVVALSLPLLVPIRRAGVRLRPRLSFPQMVSVRVRRLAVAGVAALAGQQLATLVIIRLANLRGGSGTLNVFTYVQAVTLLPYAVLAVPLATAAFPTLAGQAAAAEGTSASTSATEELVEAASRADAADVTDARTRPTDTDHVEVARLGSLDPPERPDEAAGTLRGAWIATLTAGLFGAGLLVALAIPVGAFFTALDAGRGAGSGAQALAAIPATMALMAPGTVGLAAIGLLSRALYVRGRARLAGAVVGGGWLLTLAVPLATLAADAGPAATLRAIGLGSSTGLLVAAVGLVALAARPWGWAALRVPPRPLAAAVLAASTAAAAGWGLGRVWAPVGLPAATLACVATGLLATAVFVVVGSAVDRTVLRLVLGRGRATRTSAPEGAEPS
jgi:putative peptidoglycan lipid II flippase